MSRERLWTLTCSRCGRRHAMAPLVFGCPDCATRGSVGLLECRFQPGARPRPPRGHRHGVSRYAHLLPGGRGADRLCLGEGGTPLIRSRAIGPRLGLANLFFKNEAANPTLSFKDRYVAVTVEMARKFGFRKVVVSSTGNLGVSTAAYAAAANMECLFLARESVETAVLDQARAFGSRVVVTDPATYRRAAEHLAREGGWFPMGLFMPWPVSNPFGVEGYRTLAFEMIEELGNAPSVVLFPCARGNGLYGAWKGFVEAADWGWISERPRMVACQPIGADSLTVSVAQGTTHVVELPPVSSIASSTCETIASDHALAAIRDSDGLGLAASDDEIRQAARDLAQEGLLVEYSSALPVACLTKLIESGRIELEAFVVCIVTASAVRWPKQISEGSTAVVISQGLEAVIRNLEHT